MVYIKCSTYRENITAPYYCFFTRRAHQWFSSEGANNGESLSMSWRHEVHKLKWNISFSAPKWFNENKHISAIRRCSDITWVAWCLKSLAIGKWIQEFVYVIDKENIKAIIDFRVWFAWYNVLLLPCPKGSSVFQTPLCLGYIYIKIYKKET